MRKGLFRILFLYFDIIARFIQIKIHMIDSILGIKAEILPDDLYIFSA